MRLRLPSQLVLWLLVACHRPECGRIRADAATGARPNVLLVVLDDVGTDQLSRWGLSRNVASTPTIDCLCDRGLRFDRVWANALCSPSRAEILTGRRSVRNGIGENVIGQQQLRDSETTVAEVLGAAGYATALVGKWHLGGFESPDSTAGPNLQGFDHYAGSLSNLSVGRHDLPANFDYDHWVKVSDGAVATTRVPATEDTTEEAMAFLADAPEPWFLEIAFNAAHRPYQGHLAYEGLLEGADEGLGHVLRSLSADELSRTTIVLLGDNGTPDAAGGDPDFAGKGETTESGLRVPMVFAGPMIRQPGLSTSSLVQVVDLLPTLAAIAGADLPEQPIDGVDLGPVLSDRTAVVHEILASALFDASGVHSAARDTDYKVRREPGSEDAFFAVDDVDLREDGPLDLAGLTDEQERSLVRLQDELDQLPSPSTTEP